MQMTMVIHLREWRMDVSLNTQLSFLSETSGKYEKKYLKQCIFEQGFCSQVLVIPITYNILKF